MPLMRGARPTSKDRLAAAPRHAMLGLTPVQFLWLPQHLSMWGNQIFGNCVTAEEAFAKACYTPEIFIPQHKVVKWARQNWALNGAGLWEILTLMQTGGIYQGDSQYNDGPFKSVDWGYAALLRNAIAHGPVKIGVAADQLENVPGVGVANGWIATGFSYDSNLDHCTSLCGFGTFAWLTQQLGVPLPERIKPDTAGYAMFTWSTIGIIDVPSMLAITGEAWLRSPTTVIKPNPVPSPNAGR